MSACPLCDAAEFLCCGDHVRVSDHGIETLGRCTAEDEVIAAPVDPVLARLSAVTARMRQGYAQQAAAEILSKSRATHLEQSQPREPGDDDGDE